MVGRRADSCVADTGRSASFASTLGDPLRLQIGEKYDLGQGDARIAAAALPGKANGPGFDASTIRAARDR
jgi:hypothetical protein